MGKQGLMVVIGVSVLVAFILIGLLYSLLSTALAPEEEYSYSDFEHISALEDVDGMSDDCFMVFYYDPEGASSDIVKHDVFNFTVEYQDSFTVYYLESPDDEASQSMDPPGMFVYDHGVLSDMRAGEAGIYSLLDDAASGLIP
ncbi:MAG: hypothetical protein ACOCU5_02465 [Bacillota bacterium]